jgi:hypothetical protein
VSDGRTVWWPKDAAWWRREHVVALGEEFGPAGPAVVDWLTCEAKAQNDGGWVKAGVRSCARGAFVDVDVVGAVLARAAALGALDDYELAGGRVSARISGWAQDNERGRAAFRKAQQRERDRHDPSQPVTDGHGESVKGQERRGQQDAADAASAPEAAGSSFEADVIRLCRLQSELARARTGQPPASRRLRPTRRWHEEMERLLRLDGRSPEQVEYVIRWVDRHSFWAQNVLAPDALRRHFDRFAAAIAAESRPAPAAASAAADRGAARRARAAVAFAALVQPGAEIEGREARDVA